MKLNLGCGQFHMDGYVNVDYFPPADIIGDFRHMQFSNIEAVSMIHVLEHISWQETRGLLERIHGWMSPGAEITIEVPDLRALWALGPDHDMMNIYIFGVQTSPGEFHCAGFTETTLPALVAECCFDVQSVRTFVSDNPVRVGFPCLEVVATVP